MSGRTLVVVSDWLQCWVVEPTVALLASLAVGDDIRDPGDLGPLAAGIDMLVRTEAPAKYAPWPRGSTTDGFMADMGVKVASQVLEVTGLCWMDFTGTLFPLRARIELTPDLTELAVVAVAFGEVDPMTGSPPALPSTSMIIPERDRDNRNPVAQLLIGHRLRPIAWTDAFVVGPNEVDRRAAPTKPA